MPNDLLTNLLEYWGPVGNTMKGRHAGFDMVNNNGCTFAANASAPGGRVAILNGSNQSFSLAYQVALAFTSGDMTVACCYIVDALVSSPVWISKGNLSGDYNFGEFSLEFGSGNPYIEIADVSQNLGITESEGHPTAGVLHLIVARWNHTTHLLDFFDDGAKTSNNTASNYAGLGAIQQVADWGTSIGCWNPDAGGNAAGRVAQAAIWNAALTDDQCAALYASGAFLDYSAFDDGSGGGGSVRAYSGLNIGMKLGL